MHTIAIKLLGCSMSCLNQYFTPVLFGISLAVLLRFNYSSRLSQLALFTTQRMVKLMRAIHLLRRYSATATNS